MAMNVISYTMPSFTTAASITSGMELPGVFVYMYLQVPTMSAGYSAGSTPIYLKASADGVTYYRFSNPENNTSVAGVNDFIIASSVSQRQVYIPNFSFRYVQVEISGTCTTPASAVPFKIITVSNQ